MKNFTEKRLKLQEEIELRKRLASKTKMRELVDNIHKMTEEIDEEANELMKSEKETELVSLERAVRKIYQTL